MSCLDKGWASEHPRTAGFLYEADPRTVDSECKALTRGEGSDPRDVSPHFAKHLEGALYPRVSSVSFCDGSRPQSRRPSKNGPAVPGSMPSVTAEFVFVGVALLSLGVGTVINCLHRAVNTDSGTHTFTDGCTYIYIYRRTCS